MHARTQLWLLVECVRVCVCVRGVHGCVYMHMSGVCGALVAVRVWPLAVRAYSENHARCPIRFGLIHLHTTAVVQCEIEYTYITHMHMVSGPVNTYNLPGLKRRKSMPRSRAVCSLVKCIRIRGIILLCDNCRRESEF